MKWFSIVLGLYACGVRADAWRKLEGTRYVENPANDADSFHAKRNTADYLLRLYFVDAPETDMRYPDRVQAQAAYFGVTPEQAVAGGKQAAAQVKARLQDKPLEMHTRYEDARGASQQKRIYAMVRVEDRWLSEWLVEQGWARIYGVGRSLPDGLEEERYWRRLRQLEKEARQAERGLWGVAAGTVALPGVDEGVTLRLPRPTPVFSTEPPHRLVGTLPKDWEVQLGPRTRTGYREVRFTSPGGNAFTGEVQESQLP
jgi:endonuclease YncB( thermonuclease family)